MNPNPAAASHLVVIRPEPAGGFTAQVVGLPELSATAPTREEAVRQVQARLIEMLTDGRLVSVSTAAGGPVGGWTPRDPNDPLEREFLEDLERFRREDDAACSDSSPTPTT
jgi:hypothetical protein